MSVGVHSAVAGKIDANPAAKGRAVGPLGRRRYPDFRNWGVMGMRKPLIFHNRTHPAAMSDRAADRLRDAAATAPPLLASIRHPFQWLRHIFADGTCAGPKVEAALKRIGRWPPEIVKRPRDAKGFDVQPRPWVVERTLAWLNSNRRPAKDFETLIATVQAWLFIASVQLLIRRTAYARGSGRTHI